MEPKSGRPGETETTTSAPKKQVTVQSRCNPGQHVRLLNRFKENIDFKNGLHEMGLAGFLELHITRLQRELCAALAKRVEIPTRKLKVHGQQINLSYSSMTDVLGLRSSGLDIPSNVPVDDDTMSKMCERYRLPTSGRVSIYELLSFLEEATNIDEEFKCKYLLFTIATMLRPTSNVHIYFREYVPLMSKIKVLSAFNWARFVLDALLDAIHSFQRTTCKSIRGCVIYLQILYLHNISAPSKGLYDEFLLRPPWLTVWTDERAKQFYKVVEDLGDIDSLKITDWKIHVKIEDRECKHEPIKSLIDELLSMEETINRVKRKQMEEWDHILESHKKILCCIEAVRRSCTN